MKRHLATSLIFMLLVISFSFASAQENVTIITQTSEAAEGLNLKAVSELFKESDNLEEFEEMLNDYEIGINNLDLNGDGQVDFIRVIEEVSDYTHLIILQVPLGHDEFQDVATIEIEQVGDQEYNMQIRGNEMIYGNDYYYVPTYVHYYDWPIMVWLYRPYYRPYRSVYYYGYYPGYWRPYRHVTVNVYNTRTVRYTSRQTFRESRVSKVKTINKLDYRPHTSKLVKSKTLYKSPRRTTPAVRKMNTKTRTMTREGEVSKAAKRPVNKSKGSVSTRAKRTKPKATKSRTSVKRTKSKNTGSATKSIKRTKSSSKGKTTVKRKSTKTSKPKSRKKSSSSKRSSKGSIIKKK